MQSRMLSSSPMYDKKLKATVYPWTDPFHSWIGYAYVFDSTLQPDRLFYFVPTEGTMTCRVHECSITVDRSDGRIKLSTMPQPEKDEVISTVAFK